MLSERLDSWLDRYVLLVDSLVALGLMLVLVVMWFPTSPLAVFLSFLILVPMALRRRRPVASAAGVLSIAFVHWLFLGMLPGGILPADLVVPISVYSVTAYGPRWAARLGLASGLLGSVLAGWHWQVTYSTTWLQYMVEVALMAVTVLAGWAFGRLRAVRRDQIASLRERTRLLEIEKGQQVRLAAAAERARIAREMHDVVAHSLAVIIAQADGGRYAAASSPQAAEQALHTIGGTGRLALAEMRRLLGVLRQQEAPGSSGELMPQPGIRDLPDLVERVRSGGLPVTLEHQGDRFEVEPGLGLVAYRIVQEGLTNVLKHAGPVATARVVLRWSSRCLEIDVLDDGRGAAVVAGAGGLGLIGMRERAAAFGGQVSADALVGGGHALRARIPIPDPFPLPVPS